MAVRAYAFASTFRLRELAPAFEGAEVTIAQDELRATWTVGGREGGSAVAWDFGAVVFFDSAEAAREAVVRALSARVGEKEAPRTEEFLVEVNEGARPEVRFDRVIVPALDWDARHVIALLLAQSAAMDYYEEDVAEILAHTERITRELAQDGKLRGRLRNLVRFIGQSIQTKNDIVETLALFDKPDVTWTDEALDQLYTRLRRMLEIDDRFRALEYRLRTIQDSLELLVDLSRGASTYRLEVMVVLLILSELVVMLWQVMAGGSH